ncbi:apoptosis-associated speck-like protein containing a CARD isoform X2 [Periophthalmus magnuspinnatus]|uniref:apoptosis-associated speck-like protein containing a CARD isoform X2 n=1 Tax=Periophthalmus magnuspinnatus TaxID=409849 RepID=UPI0024371F6E|nr:apoptosis-associated speck-like protein containing a CARD isoform X2 [Periophthalmus magnuspinnatus]
MAGKTVRIIIADSLEDLSPENLDKFRVRLRERKDDGARIRRAQVDGKSPLELADLLVERFTRDRAVSVAVELLRAMGCSEVAKELEEEAKDVLQPASTGQDSGASPGPGASAAPDTHRAAAEDEHFVDRHRKQLTDRVSNINPVLDELLVSGVLSSEQYSTVRAIRPTQEQMRFLYEGPLKSGGKRSKDQLLSALEDQEKYLIEDLREGQS